jgi:hypothetical protein
MLHFLDNVYHKFDAVLIGSTSILSIEFLATMSPQDMQSYFTIFMQGIVGAATIAKIGYEIYKDKNEKGKDS